LGTASYTNICSCQEKSPLDELVRASDLAGELGVEVEARVNSDAVERRLAALEREPDRRVAIPESRPPFSSEGTRPRQSVTQEGPRRAGVPGAVQRGGPLKQGVDRIRYRLSWRRHASDGRARRPIGFPFSLGEPSLDAGVRLLPTVITVILEMGLDDGSYWQRETEVLAAPQRGDYMDITDPQRSGPMPFVVATVTHRIDSHRHKPPEIAVDLGDSPTPGVPRAAEDWREILAGLGFVETRPPRNS
jgi:hypothetical protein